MERCLPTFTTSRLIIRDIEIDDIPSYERHFVDYEIIRHLSSAVPWPYPPGGVEGFLRNVILPEQGKTRWAWAIALRDNPGEMIGMVDLWREGTPENRGFWLGKAHWGHGYMTEAVAPILTYAFLNLGFRKLVFSNASGNSRSHRIKIKTGARLIGTRPATFVDPKYALAETWELTREEWEKFQDSDQN